VGQAAVDGKALYTDVPSDTLIISTGLTDIKPRQIAAAPFFMNGKVVGVLELVTLSEFTESHLELWSRISETLGAAFHTVQTRQRLAELLAASQQQAEELQAQEEELRAANEELQAQSENLKVVRELKAQKDEK
jgi:transcriptional regulator with GAF, ATPase, and Fis domain